MAAHGDHTSYVQARWAVLVRSLVVEGVPVAAAEVAVADVLSRLRAGWRRLAREEDADSRVWAEVREAAGLGPAEAGAVAPLLHDPVQREQAAAVEVSVDPFRLIDEQQRRRRRRVRRGLALALVASLVIGGYLAWATTRTPAPEVERAANPAPVPWYAEGRLHLADVVVSLPRLDGFVATGEDRVAYVDTAGRWFGVDADGAVTATSEPAAAPAIGGAGGFRVSPDRRYVLRLAAGIAVAYDVDRDLPVDSGTGPDVRVLDASFAADGTVTYVLSNLIERRASDAGVRLSETGTQVLRTCTLEPLACRDVVRVSESSGHLRLR